MCPIKGYNLGLSSNGVVDPTHPLDSTTPSRALRPPPLIYKGKKTQILLLRASNLKVPQPKNDPPA